MRKQNTKKRLTHLSTLRVQPNKRCAFRFGLKRCRAFEGDTAAAALFAGGRRIFSRSVRHRRPRGLFSLDGGYAGTLLTVDGIPNIMAETVLVRKGINVRPQNVRFSLKPDLTAILERLDWFMPVGFPQIRFYRPFFLKRTRSLSGIGRIHPQFRIRPGCRRRHLRAHVCVIGGGPAGMTAALTAADCQLQVILLESRSWLGGDADHRETVSFEGKPLYQYSRELAEKCEQHPNISVYLDTAAADLHPDGQVTAVQQKCMPMYRQQILQISARSIIVAAGCCERPLLFENNDRPGIMLTGVAHRLAGIYGILPGKQAVFSAAHDEGIETALDLNKLGVNIAAVADIRPEGCRPDLKEQLNESGIPYLKGWHPVEAKGKKQVESVILSPLDNPSESRSFACDLLAVSGGFLPRTELFTSAGIPLMFDEPADVFISRHLPECTHAAGRMLGFQDMASVKVSGQLAGLKSAADCGRAVDKEIASLQKNISGKAAFPFPSDLPMPSSSGRRIYLCTDTDTTLKHLKQAVKMGFDTPELIQRLTGAGQSSVSRFYITRLLSKMQSEPMESMQPGADHSSVRPQLCAAWAGDRTDTEKVTPLFPLVEKNAFFQRKNGWRLAERYTSDRHVQSELNAVHQHVGLMDACGRGVFRLYGPDALEVMQRIYVSDFSGLASGSSLYSAMVDENGCLWDHGIVARTGGTEYLVTTTPERAASAVEWIQMNTPEHVRFLISDLTHGSGVIRLAGPNARFLLQSVTDANVSEAAFPVMACRRMMLASQIPVQVIQAADLGVQTYDIYVSASWMRSLWEILIEKGRNASIAPFGFEAQRILHLESGHVQMDREAEMRTVLTDLQLGHLLDHGKPVQPVGYQALQTASEQKGRLKRVKFRIEEGGNKSEVALKDGAPAVEDDRICGHVCLCRYSPKAETVIGTALVREYLTEPGTRLHFFQHGLETTQRIAAAVTGQHHEDNL